MAEASTIDFTTDSVDGKSSSIHIASDQLIDPYCELCFENKGEKVTTDCFCKECNLCLCTSCHDVHKQVPSLQRHQILRGSRMPRSLADKPIKYPDCELHIGNINDRYCHEHHEMLCSECLKQNHQRCHVDTITDLCKILGSDDIKCFTAMVDNVELYVQNTQSKLQNNISDLTKEQENEIKRAEQAKQDMIQKANDMFNETVSGISKHYHNKVGEIKSHIGGLTDELHGLDEIRKKLNRKVSIKFDPNLFIQMQQMVDTTQTCKREIDDMISEIKTTNISFSFSKEISEFLACKSFVDVQEISSPLSITDDVGDIFFPYITSQAGRPYGASQAGRPYGTSQSGRPYGTSQAGRPYGTSQAGRPYITSQAGRPYITSQAGRPYITSQAGRPYGASQAGRPYGTSQSGRSYITSPAGRPYGTSQAGRSYGTSQAGRSYITSPAGRSYITSQAGRLYGTSQAGRPYITSQAGRPYGTSQAGRSYGTSQAGRSYITSPAGRPYGTSQAGRPYITSQAGRPYGTSQAGRSYGTSQAGRSYITSPAGRSYITSQAGRTILAKKNSVDISHIIARKMSHMNITTPKDNDQPWVGGLAVTDNGTLLVGDFNIPTLKVFSQDNTLLSSVPLSSDWCTDVTVTEDDIAVVSTRDKTLHFLDISNPPSSSVQRPMQLGYTVLGITTTHKDNLVVTARTTPPSVRMIDTNGKEVWSVSKGPDNQQLFDTPYYIVTSKINDTETVIVSDRLKETLTLLNANNGSLLKIVDMQGTGPLGITVDNNGNIFVACNITSEICVWSNDFTKSRTLISRKELEMEPRCIAYSRSTDTLYISYYEDCDYIERFNFLWLTNNLSHILELQNLVYRTH